MTLCETQQKSNFVIIPAELDKSYGAIEFPKGKLSLLTRTQLTTNIATMKKVGASKEQVIHSFKEFADNTLIRWNNPASKKEYISDVEYVWNTV